jgi:CcmD family protein
VVFALVLVYVAIMAVRLSRIERELGDLLAQEHSATSTGHDASDQESTLV